MPKRRPGVSSTVNPGRVEVVPRRGLNRQEAARYVGISAPKVDELVRDRQMPQPFRIGSRTVYDLRKLDTAFDVLSGPEEENSFTGWEDWDRAQPEPPKGRQAVKQADHAAHALVIQARRDARRKTSFPRMSEDYLGYHNIYMPETLAEHWKCSANHIRNLIRRGELNGHKYGDKLIRITAAVVVAYEKANIVEKEMKQP